MISLFDIDVPPFRRSMSYRTLVDFRNRITTSLSQVGVIADDVEIDIPLSARKPGGASVSWYFQGQFLHLSVSRFPTFGENCYVVMYVLREYVSRLSSGAVSVEEFISLFSEKSDVTKRRVDARSILGVSEDCMDMDEIHLKYKALAKKFHPDMASGDHEKFQEVNLAHKVLRKELLNH